MTAYNENKWPQVIELEVNSQCNRRCSYCPNSIFPEEKNNLMERKLFERVVTAISDISFSGRLSFHFFNEPLLRTDLEALVAWSRHHLPLAYFVLYSNGDLLDDARYASLLDAGVDSFHITRHSWDSFPHRPFQKVQHPSNFTISGRGGALPYSRNGINFPCYAPDEMMIVTYNGDVVLCHEDARRQNIMGNLNRQSFSEVWLSDAFQSKRKALRQGRKNAETAICFTCNNSLYLVPGTSI